MMNVLDTLFPRSISQEIAEYYYPEWQMTKENGLKILEAHLSLRLILADTRELHIRFKLPFGLGLLKLAEINAGMLDINGLTNTEFRKHLDEKTKGCNHYDPYDERVWLHFEETAMISKSYISIGLLMKSPVKYLVKLWCETCQSEASKPEDLWDGKQILEVCVNCRK
jgi:hypothetical protein